MSFERQRLVRGLAVALVTAFLIASAVLAAGGTRTPTIHAGTLQSRVLQSQHDESRAFAPGQDTNDEQGDAAGTPAEDEQCGNEDEEGADEAKDANDEDEDGADEAGENHDADEQCGDQGQQGASGDEGEQDEQPGANETSEGPETGDSDNEQGSDSGSGDSGSEH